MNWSFRIFTVTLVGTSIILVQQGAEAKSVSEIEAIARSVSVKIDLKQRDSNGTGVIIHRQGDLYTIVTNSHVVCGVNTKESIICKKLPIKETYTLQMPDGQKYSVTAPNIKILKNNLDLAIIKLRSKRNYLVANVTASENLKIDDQVFAYGFPVDLKTPKFSAGTAVSVINKRLPGDFGGYTIASSVPVLPGMSGGGIFDGNGQVVAINGLGVTLKAVSNKGIPSSLVVRNLALIGINIPSPRIMVQNHLKSADEYFYFGFKQYYEDEKNYYPGALKNFSQAIRLNPVYSHAYHFRAAVYNELKNYPKSLSDYNQALIINPKIYDSYTGRGKLKIEKLDDIAGGIADFNQAIYLNPQFLEAYEYLIDFKENKLGDLHGALADFNRMLSANPDYSTGYYNRGLLRENKLKDKAGAEQDYAKSHELWQQQHPDDI